MAGAMGTLRGFFGEMGSQIERHGFGQVAEGVGKRFQGNMKAAHTAINADNSLLWKYGIGMGVGAMAGAVGDREHRLGRIGVGMAHGAAFARGGLKHGFKSAEMKNWGAGIGIGAVGGALTGMNIGTGALLGAGGAGLVGARNRHIQGYHKYAKAQGLGSVVDGKFQFGENITGAAQAQAYERYSAQSLLEGQRRGSNWVNGLGVRAAPPPAPVATPMHRRPSPHLSRRRGR